MIGEMMLDLFTAQWRWIWADELDDKQRELQDSYLSGDADFQTHRCTLCFTRIYNKHFIILHSLEHS